MKVLRPTTGGRGKKGVALLAEKAGVHKLTLLRVMRYRSRKPRWEEACRIADAMGWSMDRLRRHLEKAA